MHFGPQGVLAALSLDFGKPRDGAGREPSPY